MGIADMPIGAFLEALASEELTPSGGSTAAVAGAMGAACCEMVCVHTDGGSDASASDVEQSAGDDASTASQTATGADLPARATELAACRERLLELADEDVAAVSAFETTSERENEAQNEAESRLLAVPVRTAETCLVVLECAEAVLRAGTPRALADGVTGVLLAAGALEAAVYTARTNLEASEEASEPTERRLASIEADAATAREAALAVVTAGSRA